jgi:hypothetical protein
MMKVSRRFVVITLLVRSTTSEPAEFSGRAKPMAHVARCPPYQVRQARLSAR